MILEPFRNGDFAVTMNTEHFREFVDECLRYGMRWGERGSDAVNYEAITRRNGPNAPHTVFCNERRRIYDLVQHIGFNRDRGSFYHNYDIETVSWDDFMRVYGGDEVPELDLEPFRDGQCVVRVGAAYRYAFYKECERQGFPRNPGWSLRPHSLQVISYGFLGHGDFGFGHGNDTYTSVGVPVISYLGYLQQYGRQSARPVVTGDALLSLLSRLCEEGAS